MFENEILLTSITAWFAAQITKCIIYSIVNRTFDASRFVGDGGMPSCHSATVSALATSCALCCGPDSSQFAISAIFAIVVMHDASGIRLASGMQAKAINEMQEFLKTWSYTTTEKKLEELLGHTPFQVLVGSLIGIAVAFVFHSLY